MTNLIVFSKDRPMQLQATLDSIEIYTRGFFNNIDVVYLATNDNYVKGYDILKKRKPYVNFIQEKNFEEDIKRCFKMDYTCMAADDDIVFSEFNKGLFRMFDDSDVCCFSLRLGTNIDYCYSNDKPNKIGKYREDGEFMIWDWNKEALDFAYPLSVVSHIFRTDFIKGLTDRISFKNTNTYEVELQTQIYECQPKMASYKQSKIFGVPANSVNSSWTNRNGLKYGYSTSGLIEMYTNGYIIDVKSIKPEEIHSAQQEIKYNFI
jgi:hypothetical protein